MGLFGVGSPSRPACGVVAGPTSTWPSDSAADPRGRRQRGESATGAAPAPEGRLGGCCGDGVGWKGAGANRTTSSHGRRMPEMDGLEARADPPDSTRRAEAAHHRGDGQGAAGERELCLQAGMDDYLTKPIRLHELIRLFVATRARPGSHGSAVDPDVLGRFGASLGARGRAVSDRHVPGPRGGAARVTTEPCSCTRPRTLDAGAHAQIECSGLQAAALERCVRLEARPGRRARPQSRSRSRIGGLERVIRELSGSAS
jgi:CheY-like chemotaxis protein